MRVFSLVVFSGVLLGWNNDVLAEENNNIRPLRPTTHPADPALSEGVIENFQRVYCDVNTITTDLQPSTAETGTGHLYIRNEYNGWVDVTVGTVSIGRLQPFTTGVIHDVKAGTYDISLSVEKVQYTAKFQATTQTEAVTLAPGNAAAVISEANEYQKPGLQDNRVYPTGKLQSYILPQ